ncbi:SH3 domain-containing protein [Streptomyces sp. NPDC015125]|uniref:SH3 domain-containing protein n=1 Tax=Streptomyces sp. NPDC015125 TaxID=3364938 RepID=UPI0036FD9B10
MPARTLIRRTAATALTASLLAAGGVALASPASAVGKSGCVHSTVPNDNVDNKRHSAAVGIPNTDGVRLRTGPGTGYSAKGSLSQYTGMHITCTSSGDRWLYGKVATGAHKGEWGWVSNKYTDLFAY